MSQSLSDLDIVRALARGRLLSAEQIRALLEEPHERPLLDVLRERRLVDESRLFDFLPTLVRPAAGPPAAPAALPAPDPAPSEPSAPRIGKFELLERIGHGGMGEVWKVRQTDLARTAALKLLVRAGATDLLRFRREAKLSASLDHPNIASVYEFGEIEGRPYILMELVRGQTLAGARLPERRLLAVVRDVAAAVHHAHARGVVHRDLKPQNLMVDVHGKAYVMDFGLARPLQDPDSPTLTKDGSLLGTPTYMAPEQVRGLAGLIGPRTDVWALGATLYQLLTGGPPFRALSNGEIFTRILKDEPVAPRRLVPRLGRDVETIVLRCLEKDPQRRYAAAGELAEDLDRVLRGEPVRARRIGLRERIVRRLARHPRALAVAAWAALVSVPLPLLLGSGADPSAELRDRFHLARRAGSPAQALAVLEELKEQDPDFRDLRPAERATREAADDDERARDAAALVDLGRRLKGRSREHAIALFAMAAGVEPRDRDARQELSSLLPSGPAARRLLDPREGEARLDLLLDPPDARVRLTPDAGLPFLAPGRYVLHASRPGFADLLCPVVLGDQGRETLDLRLPRGAAPEGFVFVSDGRGGGSYLSPRLEPLRAGRKEAAAYAASKDARLPSAAELRRVAPLWISDAQEWCADAEGAGTRAFRLAMDAP